MTQHMKIIKILQKHGYLEYDDSQFVIFEHRNSDGSFEQIKIKRDNYTITCSAYILQEDGFKTIPMQLDEQLLKMILIAIKELKKEDKNEKTE